MAAPSAKYNSSITVINKTGSLLKLGNCDPEFGVWAIAPADVPASDPSIITFTLTADAAIANGSQATVHYTVMDDSEEKFTINFCCNKDNKNYVKFKGNIEAFDINSSIKAAGILAKHPLVDTVTVSQKE